MNCLLCDNWSYNEFKEFIYNPPFIPSTFDCNKCNFNIEISNTVIGKRILFYINNNGLYSHIAHFYIAGTRENEFYYNYASQIATQNIKFNTSEEVIFYAYKYVSNYLFL